MVFRKISSKKFRERTTRLTLSSRGVRIEIDLTKFGFNGRMAAYQNYIGGDMLGVIGNDCTIEDWQSIPKLRHIAKQLRKYFYQLNNPEDEWLEMSLDMIETLPLRAY